MGLTQGERSDAAPGMDGRSPAAKGGASAPHVIRGLPNKHEAVALA